MYTYTCTLAIHVYIKDLTHLSNLLILKEYENISDCDLEVYINHILIYINPKKIRRLEDTFLGLRQ